MSAFVMLTEGFNELANELAIRAESTNNVCDVNYSITRDIREFLGLGLYEVSAEANINAAAFKMVAALFRSNVEAVYQRYEHMTEEERGFNPEPKFKRNQFFPRWTPVQLLKHLTCLRYQMSEGEIPNTQTYAKLEQLINSIAYSIVTASPEYDKAAWDFQYRLRQVG